MSCKKRGFRDRIAALMAAAKIQAKGEDRDGKTPHRAYRCPHCRAWHLTSQPKRRPVDGPANPQAPGATVRP